MGWFWADNTAASATAVPTSAPHPLPSRSNAEPPPSCPMHRKSPPSSTESASPSAARSSTIAKLNPLNYMPESISNERTSLHQSVQLPISRESSTIPRGDGAGTWEYPSPQQMYNAMLRKGYTDTPAEHVESMVAVHNFLNEGAWAEIRGWEQRFSRGLWNGWERCKRGEESGEWWNEERPRRSQRGGAASRAEAEVEEEPKLLRFEGRPSEPTPKARILGLLAYLSPAYFPDNPPFDRHDWFVQRQEQSGQTREVRYVIDYYSGPPEPTGEPVFYLDVRPAVDGPTAACERLLRWGGDVWWRASGGRAREDSR